MDPKQTTPGATGSQGGQEGQRQNPVFSPTGTLSTGANVSRTMNNLNNRDGATYGGMSFSKQNFDKIDPGSGDIILTPSARSSSSPSSSNSRRNIIIIAVIVTVLVIIGVVAAVVLNSGSKSSGQRGSSGNSGNSILADNASAQEYYNLFMNFMVNGTTDTSDVAEEFDDNKTYAVITAINDGDTQFIDTAVGYYKDFYEHFSADGTRPVVLEFASGYYDTVLLVDALSSVEQLSTSDLMEIYQSDGSNALQAVEEHYSKFAQNNASRLARAYYEDITRYSSLVLDVIAEFSDQGCIRNGQIVGNCTTSLENNIEMNRLAIEMNDISSDAYDDFVVKAFTLNSALSSTEFDEILEEAE